MEECKRCDFYFSINDLKEHIFSCNQGYTFHVQSFNLLWKQVCGGVVSDAVDMVFAEFPPMNVCSNVSSTATCEPDAKEESITTNYFEGGGRIDDSMVMKNVSACDLLRQLKEKVLKDGI